MTNTVKASTTVSVPRHEVYNQWTQFEEFPEFMSSVDRIEQLDDQRTRWDVTVGGVTRSFEAAIVEQVPDALIRWASLDGETHTGEVRFADAPEGTRVDVEMGWKPEGFTEKVGAALNLDDHAVQRDMDRFKEFIESRGRATGAWRGTVGGQAGTAEATGAAGTTGAAAGVPGGVAGATPGVPGETGGIAGQPPVGRPAPGDAI